MAHFGCVFIPVLLALPLICPAQDCPAPAGAWTGEPTWLLASKGCYAYFAEGASLSVLDACPPSNPQKISQMTLPGEIFAVKIGENYLYAVFLGGGLSILDIADPRNPVEVGVYISSDIDECRYYEGCGALEARGNNVFLLSSGLLLILDISVPETPLELSRLGIAFETPAMAMKDHYLFISYWTYILDARGTGDGGLTIVDVADPLSPRAIGSYWLNHNSLSPFALIVHDHYLFIAPDFNVNKIDDIGILDVSIPEALVRIGVIDTILEWPNGLARSGETLLAGDADGRLAIMNISHAPQVSVEGQYESSTRSWGVAATGDLAFRAEYADGIGIFDLSGCHRHHRPLGKP